MKVKTSNFPFISIVKMKSRCFTFNFQIISEMKLRSFNFNFIIKCENERTLLQFQSEMKRYPLTGGIVVFSLRSSHEKKGGGLAVARHTLFSFHDRG